jgi:hypothetical protein
MVVHMEPIADVAAVAVDRNRAPVEDIDDRQWNEFLRELEPPIVVRAIADRGIQTLRVVVSTDQVSGAALVAEYGEFGAWAVVSTNAGLFGSVDLIGRDV